MSDAQMPLAWLPFSVAEASITGKPGSDATNLREVDFLRIVLKACSAPVKPL